MKKCLAIVVLYIFCSCGNADNNSTTGNNTDSVGLTNRTSPDSVKHPSGVDNSSVISTDTAAINVQNTLKKADSLKKKQQQ